MQRAASTQSKDYHRSRMAHWNELVKSKGDIFINNDIREFNKTQSKPEKLDSRNDYDRFVGFTKLWLLGVIESNETLTDSLSSVEMIGCHFKNIDKNWWNLAIKVGKGGKLSIEERKNMPRRSHTVTRGLIYDRFMPAYCAIRENFKSRPWYHWIIHHAEYTAERDTMNAIRGMAISFTSVDKEMFDEIYDNYVKDVFSADTHKIEYKHKDKKARNNIEAENEAKEEAKIEDKAETKELPKEESIEQSVEQHIETENDVRITVNDLNFNSEWNNDVLTPDVNDMTIRNDESTSSIDEKENSKSFSSSSSL